MLLLLVNITIISSLNLSTLSFAKEEKKQIVLTAMLDVIGQVGKKERW
ncbi:hypothetical protein BH18THE2_BH18THE2_33990 [soil metagenome]